MALRLFWKIAQPSIIAWLVVLGLNGCMMGPNFRAPAAPQVKRYTETPLPAKTAHTNAKGGQSQVFVQAQEIPVEWWYLYHSPEINALVRAGIYNSPTLVAACGALRQAVETLNAQIGNSLLPAFNANLAGQRQRFAPANFGSSLPPDLFNFFNANISVSYTFDLFGSARRQIEALGAQVDYQQFQLIAAYLSLTSNIVATTIAIASYEAQIEATESLIAAQQNQLDIITQQFHLGAVSRESQLTQMTLVQQTRATLPPLQKSLSTARHALSVLVGAFPDKPLATPKLSALTLPKNIPVSLPSRLVDQRPDIRAAEALLHAASAQVGVATANLLPQITITGNYGWQTDTFSKLFTPQTVAWSIMSQITQPIFHGGALLATRRGAIAAFDQAAAQYKQTVLQAFQNVADSLRAIETDARTYREIKAAEIAAERSLKLTQTQYKLGGASYLALLTAQQQYQQVKLLSIQAQAARYTDTAALYQALGGGWWCPRRGCK